MRGGTTEDDQTRIEMRNTVLHIRSRNCFVELKQLEGNREASDVPSRVGSPPLKFFFENFRPKLRTEIH